MINGYTKVNLLFKLVLIIKYCQNKLFIGAIGKKGQAGRDYVPDNNGKYITIDFI
jgi:hypothetical protein